MSYPAIPALIEAIYRVNGGSWKAYLIYMGVRLAQMKRILKPMGSIYFHCDPTMSHGVKLLMDTIFGKENFRNEIVWCYTGPSNTIKHFPRKHDVILFYTKSDKSIFNRDAVRVPYKALHTDKGKNAKIWGDKGVLQNAETRQKYLNRGKVPEDFWIDIPSGGHISPKERTGYPTQKPLSLLERIIKASSNKGDVVLDPFCGCATACVAAERLNRQWIGIDFSEHAETIIYDRLKKQVETPLALNPSEVVKVRKILPKRTDIPPLGDMTRIKLDLHTKQEGICQLCEVPTQIGGMAIDHIIPKSKGGQDELWNFQLLCTSCNSKKSNLPMSAAIKNYANSQVEERMRKSNDEWRKKRLKEQHKKTLTSKG